MNWMLLLTTSALSGLCYRLGGMGADGAKRFPFFPTWLFNTKARDIGCSVVCGVYVLRSVDVVWGVHVLSAILLFGALCTYWDSLWGYDNHWFHGLMCGIAYFPYAIACGNWVGFGVRCIALAILMGLVSGLSSNDNVEEVGRGAALTLTLPLLFSCAF